MKNKLMLCLKLTVLPALMVAVLLLASLFWGGVVFADLSVASFLFYGTLAAYIIACCLPIFAVYALLALAFDWRRNAVGAIQSGLCCLMLSAIGLMAGESWFGDGHVEWTWVATLAALGTAVGAMMTWFLPRPMRPLA